jgi:hypothetical protein
MLSSSICAHLGNLWFFSEPFDHGSTGWVPDGNGEDSLFKGAPKILDGACVEKSRSPLKKDKTTAR